MKTEKEVSVEKKSKTKTKKIKTKASPKASKVVNSKSSKNLVIVESPAKASTIKRYLGSKFEVMASMGHIRDLPKSKIGVELSDEQNKFDPHYTVMKGKGDTVKKIKKLALKSDKVYLATDSDREGEAISWHLACLLNIPEEEECRIIFNEITEDEIKTAIKKPNKINLNLVNAQKARRVLDRIVGYSISPILWKTLQSNLSAGRVQTVTMKLIIDREEEINKFVTKEYWSISAWLNTENRISIFTKLHSRNGEKFEIPNEETALSIKTELESLNFNVSNIKKSSKKRYPTPPFTTSTLQQEASRKLNFPSSLTMKIAQELYEGIEIDNKRVGLITYMRTDSVRIAKSFQESVSKFVVEKYGEEYCPKVPNVYKSKKSIQDAHEAIRPTDVAFEPDRIDEFLTKEQNKLYRLIYLRTVASQMTEALFETLQLEITAGSYIFRSSAQNMLFDGFMRVYVEGSDIEQEDIAKIGELSNLAVGQRLDKEKIEPKQHFTQPPPRYTEASIVKEMEELGIGRPSTYAPTLSTIIRRGYVTKEKKALHPTVIGEKTTKLVENNFKNIIDVHFTANLETKLDEIEEGSKEWKNVLGEFYDDFEKELEKAKNEVANTKVEYEESDEVCEKCGRRMVYKFGRFGKFMACPGFPECKNAKPIIEYADVNCPKCGGRLIISKTKSKKVYYRCENKEGCDFLSWDKPTGDFCPKCKSALLERPTSRNSGTATILCYNKDCDYKEKVVKDTQTTEEDDE